MITPSHRVADVVLHHSECAEVFVRHRIDFCCGGERSVADAAQLRGVALDRLMTELSAAIETRRADPSPSISALPTPELVAHLEQRHAAVLEAMPFLRQLSTKVARVHGDHVPKLRELATAVAALSEELDEHLEDEQALAFGAAREGTAAETAKLMAAMRDDHEALAGLLGEIRAAADDYVLPERACNSYRTLFAELQALERELFAQLHLEMHALAPRFVTA